MQIATLNQAATMTSREIAELTGKELSNVHRDIRVMLDELKKDGSNLDHPKEDKDSRGYTTCFYLSRELTDTLLTGYSATARLRVVRRWHELESRNVIQLPKSFSEALRALADETERNEALEKSLAIAAPKVHFHDRVCEAINGQSVQEVAKVIGTGQNRLFAWLRANGLLMADNQPYQEFIDRGYFRMVERQYDDKRGESHTYTRTLVTGKGLAYIQSKYQQEAA